MARMGYIRNAHPPIRYHAARGQSMRRPYKGAVDRLIGLAAEDIKRSIPVGSTGQLRRSVDVITRSHGAEGSMGHIRIRAPHARHVLGGTRPHFVSGARLIGWVLATKSYGRRGQTPEQAAFALARHIAMQGTKPYNYLEGPLSRFRRSSRAELRRLARSEIRSWMRG